MNPKEILKKTYKLIPESQDIWLRPPRRSPIPRSETELIKLSLIVLILQGKRQLKKVCISYTLQSGTTSFRVKIIWKLVSVSTKEKYINPAVSGISNQFKDIGKIVLHLFLG